MFSYPRGDAGAEVHNTFVSSAPNGRRVCCCFFPVRSCDIGARCSRVYAGLLLVPDHDDPLDSTLALQMYISDYAYETAIEDYVKAHAR